MDRTPYLLRLDALGLDAFQMHGNEIRQLAAFGPGETEGFRDWLQQRETQRPLRALIELAEESFEIEDLPRVRGADRRALLTRRLAAWFADPAFACAEALPQAADGLAAHAERVLFSGLPQTDSIAPWLDVLQACGAALEAACPASRLCAHFGSGAKAASGAIIVHFSRAGMRLTAAAGGKALFSRLVTDLPPQTVEVDSAWIGELDRTLHYLASRRELSLPADLPILVHADAGSIVGSAAARSDPRFGDRLSFHDLPTGADSPADFDAAATAQLLRWLAAAPPQLAWGAGKSAKAHRQRQIMLAVAGVGLIATLSGAGVGVSHWQHASRDLQVQQQVAQRHLQIRQTLAGMETSSAEARLHAQRLLTTLDHPALNIAPLPTAALFHRLASTLQIFSAYELQALEWRRADASDHIGIEISLAPAALETASASAVLDALQADGALAPRLLTNSPAALRFSFELPAARLAEERQ